MEQSKSEAKDKAEVKTDRNKAQEARHAAAQAANPTAAPGTNMGGLSAHGGAPMDGGASDDRKNADGSPVARGKEPDHADVAKARADVEAKRQTLKAASAERRQSLKSGHLSGKWFAAKNSLVNMERVSRVDLPQEGDANPTVTLVVDGKDIVMAGDDAAEFMEEFGLKPLPKTVAEVPHTVTESGRLVSPENLKAEAIPNRELRIPDHPHRANAVLNNAETDAEVRARAPGATIPPTRVNIPAPLPTVPTRPGEGGILPGETESARAAERVDRAAADADAKTAGAVERPADGRAIPPSEAASKSAAKPAKVRGTGGRTKTKK